MPSSKLNLKYATIGAAQGALFIVLWLFDPTDPWLKAIDFALYFTSLFTSLSFLLIYPKKPSVLQIKQVIIIALLLGGLATWLYVQYTPGDGYQHSRGESLFAWSMVAVLLAYIALPFIQTQSLFNRQAIDYRALYRHSWDNFFVVALAGLFLLIFWLMIVLCTFLFKMLGISAVEDFLYSPYFLLTSLPIMFTIGVGIGHEHEKVISTIRFIVLSICRYLLPLSALISLIFSVTLLFTGLEALWSTGVSTHSLLWLIVINLVFVNGVYQDGENTDQYPVILKALVNLALMTLVVFACISIYSVYLRIDQYGLTPNRIYVMVISLVAFLYTASHAWAAVRSLKSKLSNNWLAEIKTPNVITAYLVAGLIILLHSPYLDPYSLSARSQFKRALDPGTDLNNFDFGVLEYKLGRPGLKYLAMLEQGELDIPEVRRKLLQERIALLRQSENYYSWKQGLRENKQYNEARKISSFDPNRVIPENLTAAFDLNYCRDIECKVLFIDLTRDGQEEALIAEQKNWGSSRVYTMQEDKSWQFTATLQHQSIDIFEQLSKGEYSFTEPHYKALTIKGKELQIVPK